jgi:hypothetical protein
MSTAALLERPAARKAPAAESTLAMPRGALAGVQLVQSASAALPGQIEAGDLLRVDFDQHTFDRDGLYVMSLGRWIGVRRVVDTLSGPRIEDGAHGRSLGNDLQILGRVLQVYAPRNPILAEAH